MNPLATWIGFEHAWWLAGLPLALLPGWGRTAKSRPVTVLALVPPDRASRWLAIGLRLAGMLAIASLLLGLAAPFRPARVVERAGQGAEIVLLLDRSRSMDQGFAGARPPASLGRGNGPEVLDWYMSQSPGRLRESKGAAARRVLSEFVAGRPQDRFGMIVFSTLPIRVLAFTQEPQAVQAAIAAGEVGRGLAETHIGLAMQAALSSFEGAPYAGSRLVLLVSDGGDRLEPGDADRIRFLARKHRVAIDWIYLRSGLSPGLGAASAPPRAGGGADAAGAADSGDAPELALHRFFAGIGTPYRAWEAGDAQALKAAIEAIDRMEKTPIVFSDTLPREPRAVACLSLGLACVALLLVASLMELRQWD